MSTLVAAQPWNSTLTAKQTAAGSHHICSAKENKTPINKKTKKKTRHPLIKKQKRKQDQVTHRRSCTTRASCSLWSRGAAEFRAAQ